VSYCWPFTFINTETLAYISKLLAKENVCQLCLDVSIMKCHRYRCSAVPYLQCPFWQHKSLWQNTISL